MNVRERLCRRFSNSYRPLNRSSVDRSSVVCRSSRESCVDHYDKSSTVLFAHNYYAFKTLFSVVTPFLWNKYATKSIGLSVRSPFPTNDSHTHAVAHTTVFSVRVYVFPVNGLFVLFTVFRKYLCLRGNVLHIISAATQRRRPSPKVKFATIVSTPPKTCRWNWKMTFQKLFVKVFNKVSLFILFSSFDPGRRPPNSLRLPVVCVRYRVYTVRSSIGYRVIVETSLQTSFSYFKYRPRSMPVGIVRRIT